MQIENLANLIHKIELEPDEAALLCLYIAGLDNEKVNSINDLFAALICSCCEHCTDHLIDPEKRLTEDETRMKAYADNMNKGFTDAVLPHKPA